MPVTGMANLAIKVADLEAACAWYEAAGAAVTEPVAWENGRRADVQLGTLSAWVPLVDLVEQIDGRERPYLGSSHRKPGR